MSGVYDLLSKTCVFFSLGVAVEHCFLQTAIYYKLWIDSFIMTFVLTFLVMYLEKKSTERLFAFYSAAVSNGIFVHPIVIAVNVHVAVLFCFAFSTAVLFTILRLCDSVKHSTKRTALFFLTNGLVILLISAVFSFVYPDRFASFIVVWLVELALSVYAIANVRVTSGDAICDAYNFLLMKTKIE